MVRRRPEPRQLPVRAAQIIAAARELLESEGREALTMRRLGLVLGIRAPSIYKHLPGKHAVEVALMEAGFAEIGEALHRVVQSGRQTGAVAALMAAYRAECLARPNLYRLATTGQLPRGELTPGLEEWAGEPWLLVAGDSFLGQAMWSFAHGMVILELDHRYPDGSDLDRTWRAGAEAFALATRRAAQGAAALTAAAHGRENG
ncbi:MAG TPA: TetR-like C-terminal domain-containing protein [Streptosporangiaceae bacterium]|jgi:AcrR family transcriptional regulator